ncbi:hypothetical protein JRQ81_012163 [Phrynocephalus forsythii]|uniref:Uncharacterized protein n=1 Tax=Phrynocephalus forsythii TaxID=171643 RepID=A0A9Q0X5D7_9SAUR|nr:hypothetical protein JRQ81_012163 [Phrynocephalus forsythii]
MGAFIKAATGLPPVQIASLNARGWAPFGWIIQENYGGATLLDGRMSLDLNSGPFPGGYNIVVVEPESPTILINPLQLLRSKQNIIRQHRSCTARGFASLTIGNNSLSNLSHIIHHGLKDEPLDTDHTTCTTPSPTLLLGHREHRHYTDAKSPPRHRADTHRTDLTRHRPNGNRPRRRQRYIRVISCSSEEDSDIDYRNHRPLPSDTEYDTDLDHSLPSSPANLPTPDSDVGDNQPPSPKEDLTLYSKIISKIAKVMDLQVQQPNTDDTTSMSGIYPIPAQEGENLFGKASIDTSHAVPH